MRDSQSILNNRSFDWVRINSSLKEIGVSPTLTMNQRCKDLAAKGLDIYRFGFGQSPFPVPEIVINALKENAFQKSYDHLQGIPTLRQEVAKYYNRRNLKYSPDQIFIGPGSKSLIGLILLVIDLPLILPIPSWVSYYPQAKMFNKPVYSVDCSKNENKLISAELLKECCFANKLDQSMLILNYPSNPVGTTYTEAELTEIAIIAKENNVLIISDEIYGDLNFNNEHLSIATFYQEGTIVTNGISKWCGAGGWRLGISIIPKELKGISKTLGFAISETYSCVSSPIQHAAIQAFRDTNEIENYKVKCRLILKTISQYVHSILRDHDPNVPVINGGFYSFPSYTSLTDKFKNMGIYNGDQLCERILKETGVALLSGSAFGLKDEFSFRLSFVDFDGEKALERLENIEDINAINIEDLVKGMAPKVYLGLLRLREWFESI